VVGVLASGVAPVVSAGGFALVGAGSPASVSAGGFVTAASSSPPHAAATSATGMSRAARRARARGRWVELTDGPCAVCWCGGGNGATARGDAASRRRDRRRQPARGRRWGGSTDGRDARAIRRRPG